MANIAESFTTPGAARLGPNSPCARIARRLACIAFLVNFILYIVAASAGVLNAIQAGANSQLRKSIDQPLLAGMTVYLTALIALSFALPFALAFTQLGSFQWSKLQTVPWWAWFGGLLSIGSTMAGVMLAQKLGSTAFTALTVTFSLLCAVVLDNFGWVGFQPHPVNFPRLAGCVLLLGGLVLVTRF